MKRIVVARHGNYRISQEDGRLTQIGINQAGKLAEIIAGTTAGEKDTILIACSPTRRTRGTAKLIEGILRNQTTADHQISTETWYELLCEYEHLYPGQAEAIHERVTGRVSDTDNIVLVGHYATAVDYSNHFMDTEFGQGIDRIKQMPKGSAVLIYPEDREYHVVPE